MMMLIVVVVMMMMMIVMMMMMMMGRMIFFQEGPVVFWNGNSLLHQTILHTRIGTPS